MMKVLKCHKGIGPKVTGEALVADDNFSTRYDLDRIKGIFSRPQHKLAGESYDQKILVLHTAKGGVASAWMLHEMTARGITPKGILFNEANTFWFKGRHWLTWPCVTDLKMAMLPALSNQDRSLKLTLQQARSESSIKSSNQSVVANPLARAGRRQIRLSQQVCRACLHQHPIFPDQSHDDISH